MLESIRNWFGKKPASPMPIQPVSSSSSTAKSHNVSPIEVKEKLDRGDPVILVDVRETEEVEIVSIPVARHIPIGEIHCRYKEISDDPNAEIVVFCHHGGRSARVMSQLWGLGYPNVQNMEGGIDRWALEVDPSLSRY